MSLVLKDRVRETTTVLGTSDATLLGAVTGFQAFSVVGNGNTCYYTISDQSGGNWEVGIGTYSTVGPTLARTTILASSNSGSIVSFPAGTKDVFLTYPSEKAVFLDANGNLNIYSDGELRLNDSAGGEYVALKSPSTLSASYTLTMPADDGTNGQVLTTDGSGGLSWTTNASGDVVGPASATDNAIARFDGTTGKLIQNSAVTIDDTTGSMTFTGSAARIYGDFSNGTTTSRLMFQSSTTNGVTSVDAIPNGTQVQSQFTALNSSDSANSSTMQITALSAESRLSAGARGTATYQPMTFYTNGSEQMRLTSTGLGIGITPGSKLNIGASAVSGTFGQTNISQLNGIRFDGQIADVATTAIYGQFGGGGGVSIGFARDAGSGTYINFCTNSAATAGAITQRMIIDNSGNVGIGTGSPSTYGAQFVNYKATGSFSYLGHSGTGTFPKVSAIGFGADTVGYTYTSSGSSATVYGSAQIAAIQSAASNAPTSLAFYTTTGGTVYERMRLDASGNLGLSITPSAWSDMTALSIAGGSSPIVGSYYQGSLGGANTMGMAQNAYYNGSSWNTIYTAATYYATRYEQQSGNHIWYNAPLTNGAISFAQAMTLDNSGNLGLGSTSPSSSISSNNVGFVMYTGAASTGVQLRLQSASTGSAPGDGVLLALSTANDLYLWNYEANSSIFGTNNTERMRIDSSGNIFIKNASNNVVIGNSASGDMYLGGGSLNTNNVIFQTGSSEKMRIDSSGNVGIGTSSPGKLLDVMSSSNPEARIRSNGGTSGNYAGLILQTYNNFSGSGQAYVRGVSSASGNSNTDLTFGTESSGFGGPVERMRIDSSGNVGIGTTSISTALTIQTPSGRTDAIACLGNNGTANNAASFGMFGNATYVSANWYYAGGQAKRVSGNGSSAINLASGTTDADTNIVFGVGKTTDSTPVERMRIDSGGVVCVAASTYASELAPAKFTVDNNFGIKNFTAAYNTTIDTGITVNQGNCGATAVVIASGHVSDGFSTASAVYILQFPYNGNYTPIATYIGGSSNFVTFGKSGSNTLTIYSGTIASYTILLST